MKAFRYRSGVVVLLMGATVACAGAGVPVTKTHPATAEATSAPGVAVAVDEMPIDASTGEAVYQRVCRLCHAVGITGAPKLGDKEAWKRRIAQGMETLVNRAINGYQGSGGMMPARGGNASLSDDEVAAAVAYMVEKSR